MSSFRATFSVPFVYLCLCLYCLFILLEDLCNPFLNIESSYQYQKVQVYWALNLKYSPPPAPLVPIPL